MEVDEDGYKDLMGEGGTFGVLVMLIDGRKVVLTLCRL